MESQADVRIAGSVEGRQREILSADARAFLARLHRRFESDRQDLLQARAARSTRLTAGEMPQFLDETAHIREADWQTAPPPPDLLDRRVEITGPVDRKMVINALNSGAKVFMADFEDANSPTWANNLDGHANLIDAIEGTITFANPDGRTYALNQNPAYLLVRPRGWHME
ncbi:MAG: malate synthase A, partial [Candidatus Dormibacteraceae bacterium]